MIGTVNFQRKCWTFVKMCADRNCFSAEQACHIFGKYSGEGNPWSLTITIEHRKICNHRKIYKQGITAYSATRKRFQNVTSRENTEFYENAPKILWKPIISAVTPPMEAKCIAFFGTALRYDIVKVGWVLSLPIREILLARFKKTVPRHVAMGGTYLVKGKCKAISMEAINSIQRQRSLSEQRRYNKTVKLYENYEHRLYENSKTKLNSGKWP